MPIYTQPLNPSASVSEATERFVADVEAWIHDCMDRYADAPATDVHDQGTYTTSWESYVRKTGDAAILAFLKTARDRMRDHYVDTGLWRHGYWTMQEAHHGTEHYELFLGMLLRLDPEDRETRRQIVDAAEHMGNWSDAAPDWFDYDRNRFHSFFFGTDGVRHEPGSALNRPDHLRCVNVCLLAYDASGRSRYLDFSARYAGEWADALLAHDAFPIGLTQEGVLTDLGNEEAASYRSHVGEASTPTSALDRAENMLASDGINTFLRLWRETGDLRFRRAAERLLDVLTTQLADPDAGAVAAAVRDYRRWTGDPRYDGAILAAVTENPPSVVSVLALDTDQRLAGRPSGVGKRSDMPFWLEDGQPRRHHPITLAVAAEISNNDGLAIHALDRARVTLALARQAFPDGRDHGCAARTVSAIARGHGRENHAGMITAVLAQRIA
jgi:hypothetical protein